MSRVPASAMPEAMPRLRVVPCRPEAIPSRPLTDVTLLASGLHFPEGPVWLSDGSVLVTEIERGTLTRVGPDGEVEVVPNCFRVIQHSNWKLFMENQIDALHPSVTHQSTGRAAREVELDIAEVAERP